MVSLHGEIPQMTTYSSFWQHILRYSRKLLKYLFWGFVFCFFVLFLFWAAPRARGPGCVRICRSLLHVFPILRRNESLSLTAVFCQQPSVWFSFHWDWSSPQTQSGNKLSEQRDRHQQRLSPTEKMVNTVYLSSRVFKRPGSVQINKGRLPASLCLWC